MDNEQQFTIVRDGQIYHTDKATVEVLHAVQKWDAGAERNAAQDLFDRALLSGRIKEGPTVSHAQGEEASPAAHRASPSKQPGDHALHQ